MIIRRLDPVHDESLLREAFFWDANAPRWYRDSDAMCRPDSVETYIAMAHDENQIDVGVFDGEMIALITVDYKTNGIVELRLSAQRHAPLDLLIQAAYQIRHQLFSLGMRAGVVWVDKRNRSVIRLCETIGFLRCGSMQRGTYQRSNGERPIEWVRMVALREDWLNEQRIAA